MNLGWNVFATSLHRQRLQQEFGDGLKAFVRLYYNNYTDAVRLEPNILDLLRQLVYEASASIDEDDLIREVEQEINDEGGVEGSDGVKHKVCTFEEEK